MIWGPLDQFCQKCWRNLNVHFLTSILHLVLHLPFLTSCYLRVSFRYNKIKFYYTKVLFWLNMPKIHDFFYIWTDLEPEIKVMLNRKLTFYEASFWESVIVDLEIGQKSFNLQMGYIDQASILTVTSWTCHNLYHLPVMAQMSEIINSCVLSLDRSLRWKTFSPAAKVNTITTFHYEVYFLSIICDRNTWVFCGEFTFLHLWPNLLNDMRGIELCV